MKRMNTRLESEGAEFLVLGQLLIHGIAAYKAYSNMPGYDVVATNPETNSLARISVKSRWQTNANGFLIKNFDCDIVVAVKLNRGSRDKRQEVRAPEYFVMPVADVRKMPRTKGWGRIDFAKIALAQYRDRWDFVEEILGTPSRLRTA